MLDDNFAFAVVRSEYPHVGQLLKEHWNEPDFSALMEELLSPRPPRRGFPSAVCTALRALDLMHAKEEAYCERQGMCSQLILDLEN